MAFGWCDVQWICWSSLKQNHLTPIDAISQFHIQHRSYFPHPIIESSVVWGSHCLLLRLHLIRSQTGSVPRLLKMQYTLPAGVYWHIMRFRHFYVWALKYSNYIARRLYAWKCLKYRKSQYWLPTVDRNNSPTVYVLLSHLCHVPVQLKSFYRYQSFPWSDPLLEATSFLKWPPPPEATSFLNRPPATTSSHFWGGGVELDAFEVYLSLLTSKHFNFFNSFNFKNLSLVYSGL